MSIWTHQWSIDDHFYGNLYNLDEPKKVLLENKEPNREGQRERERNMKQEEILWKKMKPEYFWEMKKTHTHKTQNTKSQLWGVIDTTAAKLSRYTENRNENWIDTLTLTQNSRIHFDPLHWTTELKPEQHYLLSICWRLQKKKIIVVCFVVPFCDLLFIWSSLSSSHFMPLTSQYSDYFVLFHVFLLLLFTSSFYDALNTPQKQWVFWTNEICFSKRAHFAILSYYLDAMGNMRKQIHTSTCIPYSLFCAEQ